MAHHQLEIHIGYVYGQKEPPAHASHYRPKFVAGARLPHAWIRLRDGRPPTTLLLPPIDVSYVKEFSPADVEARQYSTLDLCAFDSFTLLVGGGGSAWAERFAAAREAVGGSVIKMCLRVAGEDFDFVDPKYAELFAAEAGLDAGGGLLVRPDQHLLRVVSSGDEGEDIAGAVLGYLGL